MSEGSPHRRTPTDVLGDAIDHALARHHAAAVEAHSFSRRMQDSEWRRPACLQILVEHNPADLRFVARRLGMTYNNVRNIRAQLARQGKLPPARRGRPRGTRDGIRLQAYRALPHARDAERAASIGDSIQAYKKWRTRRGLPSNAPQGGGEKQTRQPDSSRLDRGAQPDSS